MIPPRRPLVFVATLGLAVLHGVAIGWADKPPQSATIQARVTDDRGTMSFYAGDQLITSFHKDLMGTPGFYPLISPGGHPLTRRYPIEPAGEFEKKDHPHHRSVWFTHGTVNGVDFWLDRGKDDPGKIVMTDAAVDDHDGVTRLRTEDQWQGPDGKVVLTDQRDFTFDLIDGRVLIGMRFLLQAGDEPVNFGDDKEGTLGVRVGGLMKVDAKAGGTAVNDQGLVDGAAWSKPAAWVDYSGPTTRLDGSQPDVAGAPVAGITMMYHPGNAIQPCRWHVREYGLFAANPFARQQFGLPGYDGVTIPAGESLTFDFLVVLHDGPLDRAATERIYADYAGRER